jgi:nucleoside-diphosphate-sugar epimerase
MKIYLVTGGAGFIGSHLVEKLLADDCYVKIYDNFSTGSMKNILECAGKNNARLEVIHGDIRDANMLSEAMLGVDGVFHLAALVSVPKSIEEPDVSFDINSNGTQIVLNVARQCKVSRLVLASSAAVYGNCIKVPISESEQTKPLSPYGLDKIIAEQLGELYFSLYGTNVTCLRFFNVFGPRQQPNSSYSGVVSKFAMKTSSKLSPTIFGDGTQLRDFIYVKDVADALVLSMRSEYFGFQIFNVGTGHGISINALWNIFNGFTDANLTAEYEMAREGDIQCSIADISLIKKYLKLQPSVSFTQHLYETYEWVTKNASIES